MDLPALPVMIEPLEVILIPARRIHRYTHTHNESKKEKHWSDCHRPLLLLCWGHVESMLTLLFDRCMRVGFLIHRNRPSFLSFQFACVYMHAYTCHVLLTHPSNRSFFVRARKLRFPFMIHTLLFHMNKRYTNKPSFFIWMRGLAYMHACRPLAFVRWRRGLATWSVCGDSKVQKFKTLMMQIQKFKHWLSTIHFWINFLLK